MCAFAGLLVKYFSTVSFVENVNKALSRQFKREGLSLLDVNKFPSAKEILKFAEKCLNIEIKNYWLKRSRAEAAGIVLNEVYEQSPQQFNKFLKAWNKFNSESNSSSLDNKKLSDEKGFMESWFEFFDSYKGVE